MEPKRTMIASVGHELDRAWQGPKGARWDPWGPCGVGGRSGPVGTAVLPSNYISPFCLPRKMGRFRGADGVGRPDGADGCLLATKRSDSSAERRICALEDRSTLLGHLNLVEARLAPTTRLLLAAPHPTPPSGGRRAHDGRLRGQPSSAGRLCGRRGCRPPVAAGGRRPGPPRPAQTALLGRSATPGRAAAASVVVGWGGACTRAAPRRGWSGRCDAYGPSGTRTDLRYRGVGQGPAVQPQRGRLPFPPLFCKIFVHLVNRVCR